MEEPFLEPFRTDRDGSLLISVTPEPAFVVATCKTALNIGFGGTFADDLTIRPLVLGDRREMVPYQTSKGLL
jgi:hypothetical protein